jgi:hypothetical protein
MHSVIFLLVFNLLPIVTTKSPHIFHTSTFDEYVCQPCTRPLDSAFLLLPSQLKCLNKGDSLFKWPGSDVEESGPEQLTKTDGYHRCVPRTEIQSDAIHLDDGVAKMKKRECFYHERTLKYKWRCTKDDEWRRSELRVAVRVSTLNNSHFGSDQKFTLHNLVPLHQTQPTLAFTAPSSKTFTDPFPARQICRGTL